MAGGACGKACRHLAAMLGMKRGSDRALIARAAAHSGAVALSAAAFRLTPRTR